MNIVEDVFENDNVRVYRRFDKASNIYDYSIEVNRLSSIYLKQNEFLALLEIMDEFLVDPITISQTVLSLPPEEELQEAKRALDERIKSEKNTEQNGQLSITFNS